MAAIWRSLRASRYLKMSSSWCCSKAQSSFAYLKYMMAVVMRRLKGHAWRHDSSRAQRRLPGFGDPRIHVQVDGEYMGLLPAKVEIVPRALTLLVPPGFRAAGPRRVEPMDNLTHTLTGLVLSRAGLNRWYARAPCC